MTDHTPTFPAVSFAHRIDAVTVTARTHRDMRGYEVTVHATRDHLQSSAQFWRFVARLPNGDHLQSVKDFGPVGPESETGAVMAQADEYAQRLLTTYVPHETASLAYNRVRNGFARVDAGAGWTTFLPVEPPEPETWLVEPMEGDELGPVEANRDDENDVALGGRVGR